MNKLSKKLLKEIYREYLILILVKPGRIKGRLCLLDYFLNYLERKEKEIKEVKEKDIYDYIGEINKKISKITKRPFGESYKQNGIFVVKDLFDCLYLEGRILVNPGKEVKYCKKVECREKVIFTREEIGLLLDSIDTAEENGLRDRTIYELLYATGIRINELRSLRKKDLDMENRTVYIRNGKMGKDRTAPIADVAYYFLKEYLKKRKELKEEDKIFPAGYNAISKRLRKYIEKSGIRKKGFTLHGFRHSIATHLLKNGAGIRYVQEMLGHESIKTTMIYTHMNIESLKKIYKTYHPGENNLYREGGEEYKKKIEEFVERLKKAKKKNERDKKTRQKKIIEQMKLKEYSFLS